MPQLPYPKTNLDDVKERADDQYGAEDCTPHSCGRAAWLTRFPAWACVALGGFCGTALRLGADLAAAGGPRIGVFAWSTVCVNLVGAFFLGYLTAWAQGYFREDAVRRKVMLVAGSGFAGALTTYATMVMASIHNAVQAMTAVPAAGSDLSGAVSSSFSAAVESSLPLLIEGMLASLVLLVVGIGIAALGYSLGIRAGGSSQLGDNQKASEMPEVLRTASASSPTSNEDSCPRGAKK